MKNFHNKLFPNYETAAKAFKLAKRIYPKAHVFMTNEGIGNSSVIGWNVVIDTPY